MKQQYDVTIGMSVYRAKPYIRKSLLSALAQSYSSVCFLIIDDGDDMGSMEVVHELQATHPRGGDIRIVALPRNQGAGSARNHIIDETTTGFLYFMDSDDVIEPETIELLMREQDRQQAELVFGSYEQSLLHGDKLPQLHRYPRLSFTEKGALATYAYRHYGGFQSSVCNVLMNVAFLRSTGVRFIDASYWEDMAFTYELLPHVSRAVLLPKVTYHYLCRPDSLSHYQDRDVIVKAEVMKNIGTIEYLKQFSARVQDQPYAGYLSYSLLMHDLYINCQILEKRRLISPGFSLQEMRHIMWHPFALSDILRLKHYRWRNLVLALMGRLPSWCFLLLVRLFMKIKR